MATGTKRRSSLLVPALVLVGVLVAAAAVFDWDSGDNIGHDTKRGRAHVVHVDTRSDATLTRIDGNAVSNLRQEIWKMKPNRRKKEQMPTRDVFVVYDNESVSINVKMRVDNQPEETHLTCRITVDGVVPDSGRPENETYVPRKVASTLPCHYNWVGESA